MFVYVVIFLTLAYITIKSFITTIRFLFKGLPMLKKCKAVREEVSEITFMDNWYPKIDNPMKYYLVICVAGVAISIITALLLYGWILCFKYVPIN